MKNAPTFPAPPDLADLNWRQITHDDLSSLVELARACLSTDGGLGFLFEPDSLEERYFPDAPYAAIGAFTSDGRLAACASVRIDKEASPKRAVVIGQVRPDLRGRGFGGYLMQWSQGKAQSLLADESANQPIIQIATESLTAAADRLYRASGFENVFESLVMQRTLRQPIPDRPLPPGVTLAIWQPDLAGQFFQAYHSAFRDRPGFPGWSTAEWIARVTENDLIPEWSLLAQAGDEPLGFVIGNADLTTDPPGGFVWQIGVIPAQRRRGLASALLVETMRRMQAAGADSAQLTVNINNPGAIQAYTRLGYVTIGRRARYERIAPR